MNRELIISLINNTALLLAINIITTQIFFSKTGNNLKRDIIIGSLIGFVCICLMLNPFQLAPGVFFDTRSILISLTGFFLDFIPTLIAALITIIYRVYVGGTGTLAGVLVVTSSAVLGLFWHHFRISKIIKDRKNRILELYFFGVIVHIAMLICMLAMPKEIAFPTLNNISIPVMIIYPFGTVMLGILILNQRDAYHMNLQIEENEELYRSLFANNHAIMMLIDPESGKIIDANPAACTFYGWEHAELTRLTIHDINILSASEVFQEMRLAEEQKRTHFIFQHRLASGEIRDVEVYSGSILVNSQKLLYSIIHDITERKTAERRLRESEQRLEVTLLSVGDGFIATDKNGIITMINRMGEEITGWPKEEALGKSINDIFKIINEYTRKPVEDPVKKVLETGRIIGLANHTILICKDGTEKPIADSAAPIKDDLGKVQGVVLVIRDATDERKKQQEIIHLGYHDSLTDLYNRRFFDEAIHNLDHPENLPISIIMGDVNGLKLINDAFGHMVGDTLLKKMATMIKDSCRPNDIVARWGGDEFIVLLPQTSASEAETISNKIKYACANVKIDNVSFSISLGHDTKYLPSIEIDNVIKKAEDFMYRNKLIETQSNRAQTINTILMTLHEKSSRERMHSNRVSKICQDIGLAMNLNEKTITELGLTGLLHDIGKIAINDFILDKTETLTNEEWVEIKRHPEIGYRILSASNSMSYLAEYVLAHHERLDGSGYPNKRIASEIPLQARILAVADTYDAMTSDRPYRAALTTEAAINELQKEAGVKLDAMIVKILIEKVIKVENEK